MRAQATIASGVMVFLLGACVGGDDGTPGASATNTTTETTGGTTEGTTEGTTDGTTEGTTDGTTDGTTGTTGGSVPDGGACEANDECMSLACLKFTDNDPGAVCTAAPDGGNTRITGTIFNFTTGETIGGADLKVVGAIQAIIDPVNVEPLVQGASDTMGRVDVTSAVPLMASVGLLGLVSPADYALTATGLAQPIGFDNYGPLNTIHDIWAVPFKDMTTWGDLLMADPEVMPFLPLVDKGAVVGKVRAKGSGAPVAGAKIIGADAPTGAIIRYLNEAGDGFTTDMTSANGIFIMLDPETAETFTVEIDGVVQADVVNKAGSAPGVAFTMILNVAG